MKSPRKVTYGCIKDKHKGRGEREILPGVAVGCQGWAVVLLASRAYGAHKRNLHLRATPALSLHPEKARNKRNEFYAVATKCKRRRDDESFGSASGISRNL